MRSDLEDSKLHTIDWRSGRWSTTRKVLSETQVIGDGATIVHFLDPDGSDRDVQLPPLDKSGKVFLIVNSGTSGNLNIVSANGAEVATLLPRNSSFVVSDEGEWFALRAWADLSVFTNDVDGLVPHPGSAMPGSLFLRNDGEWAQVQVTGIVDAFKYITDGTNTAVGAGPDTFRLRSSSQKLDIVVTNNEAVFGDNANFDVVEAFVDHDALLNFVADEHVAHSGVVLTAGEGLSGGGDISVSRTFDLALTELTPDSASALADISLSGTNGTGLNRIFSLSYLNSILVHNNLSGYEADRHIAHSTVTISGTDGIQGGGNIAASRVLSLDFFGLDTDVIASADVFAFFDDSAGDHKKISFNTLNTSLDHDTLNGINADEHVPHSSVSVVAGAGLTGGGTIEASRTVNVGAGTGITVNTDDVALDPTNTRNTDHSAVEVVAGAGLTGGGDLTATRTLDVGAGTGISVNANDVALDITHDRNVAHSDVSIIAGNGLSGGGDISASITLDINIEELLEDITPASTAYVMVSDGGNLSKVPVSSLLSSGITTGKAIAMAIVFGG